VYEKKKKMSALQYDRVLVMKHGRVTEIGRLVELLNLKGAFYGLWKSQELKNDT